MQKDSFNFHVYLFWLPHLLNLDYHKIRKYWALILKMNNSILKTFLPNSKYHEINWTKYRGLLYLFDFKLFWTLMIIDKIVKSLCPFYSIEINKLWFIVMTTTNHVTTNSGIFDDNCYDPSKNYSQVEIIIYFFLKLVPVCL